jgi:hypothetical protein
VSWSDESTILASGSGGVSNAALVACVWFVVRAEGIACLFVDLTIEAREFRSAYNITDEASMKMNVSN